MDLDRAFVSAVVADGLDGWKRIKSVGISETLLDGAGREVFLFLSEYVTQYGGLPTLDIIDGKLGVQLDLVPGAPLDFLAGEVLNRKIHLDLSRGYQDGVRFLEKNDPRQALDVTERLVHALRKDVAGDVRAFPITDLNDEVLTWYNRIKLGERGILTPWEKLNEATFGFWPGDLVLFAARTGIGKCAKYDTTLQNPKTGIIRTIEELYNDPSWGGVTTWSKEDGIHVLPITAKHATGYKTCLKFSLKTGRSVSVTPEHPFLTPEGWKRADELKPGHTVGLPAHMPFPLEPVDLPRHEVDLLAIMLADGACTAKEVKFTKQDEAVVTLGCEVAKTLGIRLVSSGNDHTFSTRGIGVSKNPAKVILERYGLARVLSKNKVIPEAIFRLPKESLARFLAVFWMCDGYEEHGTACITLASEKMVRQLQHLFLRFGIQSSVGHKKAKCQTGEFDAWILRIYSQCVQIFLKEIPATGVKMDRLCASYACRGASNANVGFPRVSEDLMRRIKAEAGDFRKKDPIRTAAKRRVADRLGRKEFSPKDLFKKHGEMYSVSLDALRVYSEEFGCTDKYRWLWDADVFWDVVEAVEDVGEQKIYDLTVAPTACFIADDVIVHNTWLSLIIAHYAWTCGHKVLFATTEVGSLALALRWTALHNKISYDELRHGRLTSRDEQKMMDGLAAAKGAVEGFYVVGGTFDFQLSTLDLAISELKPALVVADGANLFKAEGGSRIERAANTMDEFKRTAIRRKVPILLTLQFNREVKSGSSSKALKVEKLSQTDAGGWNADQIYGLWQTEEMKADGRMGMQPMKCREGVAKPWELYWDLHRMDFSAIADSAGGVSDADDSYGTGLDFSAPPSDTDTGDTDATPF